MLLHKIYYFTARQIEFVSLLSFYCFRWFHIWYDAAKDGWCARNPFKQFGISFYAQISNDFYVQQMLLLPLCSSDQQIAEYPHILFYSIVAIVCAGHVLERSLAVCVASIPPYASHHRWLCHFVAEASVSVHVMRTIVPFHFVCVRVWLAAH